VISWSVSFHENVQKWQLHTHGSMVTNFCDFRRFSAIFGGKMAFFLKSQCYVIFLQKLAVVIAKNDSIGAWTKILNVKLLAGTQKMIPGHVHETATSAVFFSLVCRDEQIGNVGFSKTEKHRTPLKECCANWIGKKQCLLPKTGEHLN
jgi:hypothetical protein